MGNRNPAQQPALTRVYVLCIFVYSFWLNRKKFSKELKIT